VKIINRVGERLLPRWLRNELRPVLAFAGAGTTLWSGSCELVRRGWAELGERCTVWERLGVLAGGGYLTVYGCAHAPHAAVFAAPAVLLAWCVAAWWVAPPTAVEPEQAAEVSASSDAFVPWLLQLMGDRPGIHLRELYPAMRQLPGHEDRDNGQLRAALNTLGIPVTRSLRLGGVAGRSGVARADIEALPSPSGESGGETDGDAGQSPDSPQVSVVGEGVESA
jgi:hypothetical protein